MLRTAYKKLFCLHQWESHATTSPTTSLFYLNKEGLMEKVEAKGVTTEVLFCTECGKIKIIKY